MFCRKPLGQNEVLESFPVGRRLAFDAERGRLWVVCAKCERWNLTPLEERWEAVEDCERIYRGTKIRVSTENIGLARHREGLVLVRIGKPLRPEFAAWRYGDQFGKRRRMGFVYGGAAAVATGGIAAGTIALGFVGALAIAQGVSLAQMVLRKRHLTRLRTDDGEVIEMHVPEAMKSRIRPSDEGGPFRLDLHRGRKLQWPTIGLWASTPPWKDQWSSHEGEEARRFAGQLLPSVNMMGGSKRTVAKAVDQIESAGHPERFIADVANSKDLHSWRSSGYLAQMASPTRLALEMALHEEQERRALEGELRELERAWREAEEIADISDKLLLPSGTDDFIRRHRE